MKEHVVLIGFPTVGKTTVGKLMANILQRRFIDTDDLMRERGVWPTNMVTPEDIQNFRDHEEQVVLSLTEDMGASVVATGGSVVYSATAMQHLSSLGSIVYLRMGVDVLAQRLRDAPERPIVVPPGQSWDDMLTERTTLYAQYANLTVDSFGTPEQTARRVIQAL